MLPEILFFFDLFICARRKLNASKKHISYYLKEKQSTDLGIKKHIQDDECSKDTENKTLYHKDINISKLHFLNTIDDIKISGITKNYDSKKSDVYKIDTDLYMHRMPFSRTIYENQTIIVKIKCIYYENLNYPEENRNFCNFSENVEKFFKFFFSIDISKTTKELNEKIRTEFWYLVNCFFQHYKLALRSHYKFCVSYNQNKSHFIYENQDYIESVKDSDALKNVRNGYSVFLQFYGGRALEICDKIDFIIAEIQSKTEK